MNNKSLEWLKQADYDMETAVFMSTGGRFFYSIFMCHLAIEKALKGLYQERLDEIPPKIHNFVYLLNKIGVMPPEAVGRFIVKLNEASVITRYPEDLDKLKKEYTEFTTKNIIEETRKALQWIKGQF